MSSTNGSISSGNLKDVVEREFDRLLEDRRELRLEAERLEAHPLQIKDVIADLVTSRKQSSKAQNKPS